MSRRRPDWELPESGFTDESVYLNRRRFLQAIGVGGLAASGFAIGTRAWIDAARAEGVPKMPKLAAVKNADYADAGRPIAEDPWPLRSNNFYEAS